MKNNITLFLLFLTIISITTFGMHTPPNGSPLQRRPTMPLPLHPVRTRQRPGGLSPLQRRNAQILIFHDLPPLHEASRTNNLERIRSLATTATINAYDEMGFAPLHYAIMSENMQAIHLLLQLGADIFKPLQNGTSIRDFAQFHEISTHLAPIITNSSLLLSFIKNKQLQETLNTLQWQADDGLHGVCVNTWEEDSRTPLHLAIKNAGSDIQSPWIYVIRTLIARGANMNTLDQNGASPLDFAAHYQNPVIGRLLVAHGSHAFNHTNGNSTAFLLNNVFGSR